MSDGKYADAEKAALRKRIIAQRDAISAADHLAWSRCIADRITAQAAYRDARCVMAYASFGSEFDTGALLADILATGKRLVLPRAERATRRLHLFEVANLLSDLQPGVWGIREPAPSRCNAVSDEVVDLVLTPGVAFTRHGDRLGYGAGFYDRFVARLPRRPALLAAAFAFQVVETLPAQAHDQRIDALITERELIRCA